MRGIWIATVLGIVLTMGPSPQTAQAEHHEGGPKVMQVFTIDADAKDRPAVLARFKALQGILAKEGQPAFQVWAATYAGNSTGRMFLTIEQNNYATFGANAGKIMGSAPVQKWLEDMNKSGLATVVSQSLIVEVTP